MSTYNDDDALDYDMDSASGSGSPAASRSNSPARSVSRSRSSSESSSGSNSSVHSGIPQVGISDSALGDLQLLVKRQIDLQSGDVASPINQRDIFAQAKAKYKAKSLLEAYVPYARTNASTGEHLAGCPCSICVSLEQELDADDKELISSIRGLRNWVPVGQSRLLSLLLPAAAPASGQTPQPYVFSMARSVLLKLEKRFLDGDFLHPLIYRGDKAGASAALSPKWVGGKSEQRLSSAATSGSLDPSFSVPKMGKAVHFVRDGPSSWDRFAIKETCAKPAKFIATEEAMARARDIQSLGIPSLDKKVKSWTQDHLRLPLRQFEQVKQPAMPNKFSSVARLDTQAAAKERALFAVGNAHNFVTVGALRISETVAVLDEVIPNLEISVTRLENHKPPVYIAPGDRHKIGDITEGMDPSRMVYVDPIDGDPDHWLRSKGEGVLANSSIIKDVYVPPPDPELEDDNLPPMVDREKYTEVCWRLVLMREFVKRMQIYASDGAKMISHLTNAMAVMSPELRQFQDVFANQMYPAVGLVHSTILHQRMDHFRDILTADFKEFAKAKSAADPLPDGSLRPAIQYLIEDPGAICDEFAEWVKNRAKHQDVFKKTNNGNRQEPFKKRNKLSRNRKRESHPNNSDDKSRDDRDTSPAGKTPKERKRKRSPDNSHSNAKSSKRDDDKRQRSPGPAKASSSSRKKKQGGRSEGRRKNKGKFLPFSPSLVGLHSKPTTELPLPLISKDSLDFVSSLGFDISSLGFILSLSAACRTQSCIPAWRVITESKWVLKMISKGVTWSWKTSPPSRSFRGPSRTIGCREVLQKEVDALKKKGALVTRDALPSPGPDFVVSYFAVPKKDKNKFRPVINLKPLNALVANSKFKMESVKSVRQWLVKGAFMVSLDLSDAYLSLAVELDRWIFLGFEWEGIDYFYKCLCFGLNVAHEFSPSA